MLCRFNNTANCTVNMAQQAGQVVGPGVHRLRGEALAGAQSVTVGPAGQVTRAELAEDLGAMLNAAAKKAAGVVPQLLKKGQLP